MFRLKIPPRELKMYWPQVYLFPIAHACSHKEETTKGCLMFSCSRSWWEAGRLKVLACASNLFPPTFPRVGKKYLWTLCYSKAHSVQLALTYKPLTSLNLEWVLISRLIQLEYFDFVWLTKSWVCVISRSERLFWRLLCLVCLPPIVSITLLMIAQGYVFSLSFSPISISLSLPDTWLILNRLWLVFS